MAIFSHFTYYVNVSEFVDKFFKFILKEDYHGYSR